MNSELIALLLDIVILVFLGATIFYVLRLSKSLEAFKSHRREFDNVITSLLSSIDQAERSVQALKQASAQEAGELQGLITQSKAISEELKIINEAGEGMAKRLEQLAEKNRVAVQSSRPAMKSSNNALRNRAYNSQHDNKHGKIVDKDDHRDYTSTLKNVETFEDELDMPSFMIQDRDIADLDALEDHLDSSVSNDAFIGDDDQNDVMPEDLQSQAEKELLDALRASKSDITRRRRT